MKISLNWIRKFVNVPKKSARELAELLTLRTCEVEGWEDQSEQFKNMVIGKIKKIKPHPNADKLRICETDIGGTLAQIVCGGANVKEGMLVPVALSGAKVKWHGQEEWTELKEAEIRGVKSFGMICAGEEIGIAKCPPGEISNLSHLEVTPGTPLSGALHLDDVIFEIDNKSLTHRPDLWGHYGMAREFSVFMKKSLKKYELASGISKVSFPKTGEKVNVVIEDNKICSRFACVIISGIKVEESPAWLKNQLMAVGMRPVNNIVDVTNFVMHELGQPLHAFDRRVVENDTFIMRFAKNGEKIETLDHKVRTLTSSDALVTNGDRALGIAGVMGGKNSEIHGGTTDIILEVATWNPILVRKTAKHHNLRSDAAQRFEKSLDPALVELAIKRATQLILQLCPSAKTGPVTDIKIGKPKPIIVKVSISNICKKIGVTISEKDIVYILKSLEFSTKKSGKDTLVVTVPTFRATNDVDIEDDIVEEVARMYGYEKIPALLPHLPIKLPHENIERKLKHWSREILSLGLGFTETSLYSFYNKVDFEKCLLPENIHLTVENPLSEDQTHMRASLLPNMLKLVSRNSDERDSFRVYEIGRQYRMAGSYFPREEKYICGVVYEKNSNADAVFYEAKGAVEEFLSKFPVSNFSFEESKEIPPYAHPKKCADVLAGRVFELHPQVAKNFGITGRVGIFEINFSILANLKIAERKYEPLPKFPGISIDIAVLVDRYTKSRDLERLMKKAGGELVQKISLFDTFTGKELGSDKKSLAYRLELRSDDRTLTDEDMHKVQMGITQKLQQEGYQVR